ncbi:vacuolar amino acid permease [Atractiella rhizophila]|nr:vacuolar amino acid permease [Atractiella rhizophila]
MSGTSTARNEEGEAFLSPSKKRRDSQSSARSCSSPGLEGSSVLSLPRSLRSASLKTLLSHERDTQTDSPPDRDAETQPLLGAGDGTIKKLTDPGGPLSLSTGKRNIILFAVWGAYFATLMTTLLPLVSSSFQSAHEASWLGTSYLLSTLTFTPLYGRLLDIVGRRNSILFAMGTFAVGTGLCGIAWSMKSLIAARFIAGMGGGGMTTAATVITGDLLTMKGRAVAVIFSTMFWAIGGALGGPFGGFLADSVGWRFAFLIQIPFLVLFSIVTFISIDYKLPHQSDRKRTPQEIIRRIDWFGSLTLFGGFLGLLIGLSEKNNEAHPFSDPKVHVPLILAACFFSSFLVIEAFWVKEPIFPFPALRSRTRVFTGFMQFFTAISNLMVIYHFPTWYIVMEGASGSEAGLHMIPQSIGATLGSAFAGWIIYKTGRYWWMSVVSGLLPIWSAYLITNLEPDSPSIMRWLAIFPSGFGYSSMMSGSFIALQASVPHSQLAVITGSNFIFRGFGQTLGVGLGGAILQSTLSRELAARIHGPDSDGLIARIRHDTAFLRELPVELKTEALASYRIALKSVFAWAMITATLDWLCCLNMGVHSLEEKDRLQDPEEEN